jgi:acid phosphatase (class A)
MMKSNRFAAFAAVVFLSAAGGAASQSARPPGYLAEAVNGAALVGAPPAVESGQQAAERANFEATRALQGSERWAQAVQDNELTPAALFGGFGCAAGVSMSTDATPATARLLARVGSDIAKASSTSKGAYNRPRPPVGNDLPICIAREPSLMANSSWPSGHAMLGWTYALLLAEMVPSRAEAILKRGHDFGDSRVICGVHFQSDVEAGRTVAAALVAKLHADPAFAADLAAAKAELAKAEPAQCPLRKAG